MKKTLYKTDQNNPQIRAYKDAVKRGLHSYHVIYRGSEWIVKRADSERASQVFESQKKAEEYGRGIARNQGTALLIHKTNGTIGEMVDYANS